MTRGKRPGPIAAGTFTFEIAPSGVPRGGALPGARLPGDPAAGHSHGHGVPTDAGFVAAPSAWPSAEPLALGAGVGKVLYLDCPSGIAGDMTLAALLDLGVPEQVFSRVPVDLGLERVELVFETGYAGVIGCRHLSVVVHAEQPPRRYAAIRELLDRARLDEDVRRLAGRIFERLAHAEAEVHRTTLDDVHFHEVGAVDALVDVVGAAAGFTYLGARVLGGRLPLGSGYVDCAHGRLPLPAPATLLCLRGVPTTSSGLDVELVTPTGAAIYATVVEEFFDWPPLAVTRVGWGAGTRGLVDRPNALRVILGEPLLGAAEDGSGAPIDASARDRALRDRVVELATNLDDCTGEIAAHVVGLLLDAGALDAWVTPIVMKKGRPGMLLGALAPVDRAAVLSRLILDETTSLGVRQRIVDRAILPREMEDVTTIYGTIPVKWSGLLRAKPEIDVCIEISRREGVPLRSVVAAAVAAAERAGHPRDRR